jgi:DNA modification methylase
MVTYTCNICQRVFTQKGHFSAHQRRKRPCVQQKPLAEIVEEKVKETLLSHKFEDVCIYHQSCLDGLKTLETEIHLTVTSPPYFNVKEYVSYDSYKEYLQSLKDVFALVLNRTAPGRMCCVNLSNIIVARESRSHESSRIPLAFHFVPLMEDLGWKFIEDIVWVKPEGSAKNRNGGFFQHRQPLAYKPNVINEYILVFQKPAKTLIDSIVRKYDAHTAEVSKVADGYERTNVWELNPETKSKHPAPYPTSLVERLVRYYSYVGDTVLDPYMGSGTTAVVAHELNRKCVGYEIHQEYVDMTMERLKSSTKEPVPKTIVIPEMPQEKLKGWLSSQSKRFLMEFSEVKTLSKLQLVSSIYERLTSTH